MDLRDFKRLIQPIKNKIFLLLGRAILKAVNNSEGTQKVQIVVLDGETITDVERFQEYGFETYPLADSEAFGAFLNGNRGHGIILCVHDRRYRPTDLSEGETAIYTYEDQNSGGHRIHLKNGQEIEILGNDLNITITGDATITAGGSVTVNAQNGVEIDGGLGNTTGVICGRSICHFTGLYHQDVSQDVTTSKT